MEIEKNQVVSLDKQIEIMKSIDNIRKIIDELEKNYEFFRRRNTIRYSPCFSIKPSYHI
mgnify:CR=1 FL=1